MKYNYKFKTCNVCLFFSCVAPSLLKFVGKNYFVRRCLKISKMKPILSGVYQGKSANSSSVVVFKRCLDV